MQKIYLGPAGSPVNSTLEGIAKVKELGLNWMEVQFSHGVKMSLDLAEKISHEKKKHEIDLSIHAPYYINLASKDPKKKADSIKRILDSCERGHLMGAKYIVFHPGYFGDFGKEECYQMVMKAVQEIMGIIKQRRWNVQLAPETTGKHAALGDLEETIRLMKDTGCYMCIDPAHLYARGFGKIDYSKILDQLEVLNLNHYHFHFSGIAYSKAGEVHHLVLDGKPDFKKFAEEILNRKISCSIVSESPITWKDSLKMKNIFIDLGYKGFGDEKAVVPDSDTLADF